MLKQQKRNFPAGSTIKYLNKQEWDRFRACIDNYRDKLMVLVLYSTGMRVGEFTKLKIQDIDFQERFISIPGQNTKTGIPRTVWVSPETLSEIRAYIKLTKKGGRLFDLTPRRVQQLIKQYSKRSGVKVTPHTLRHTHIVHALLKRVPVTAIQKQVGHKRLATTQIYSDFAPEQVREAYERQEK